MERIQPQGVFAVGILTTLSALAVFYLAFLAYYISIDPLLHDSSGWTMAALFGGFGVLLLADAILIFRGMRAGWYLSIVLWVVLLSGLCIIYYRLFLPVVRGSATFGDVNLQTIGVIALTMCPLLYPAIGLMYFLKKSVREYFGT
jgi:hypothetical protein